MVIQEPSDCAGSGAEAGKHAWCNHLSTDQPTDLKFGPGSYAVLTEFLSRTTLWEKYFCFKVFIK